MFVISFCCFDRTLFVVIVLGLRTLAVLAYD